MKKHKYIFVIGGVMSGVGKGIATSSIGKILQAKGFKVNPVKIDPYLNVDAGTMNPTEHGEVFVLNSGLETDQDMGNYERFMEVDLGNGDYMTSGMVYKTVIEKERNLGYGGKCVEAIPHITGEIRRRLEEAAEKNNSDISVIEVGGTVGDYQNIMFIEAARVMAITKPGDVIFILVSYLPVPGNIGEMKTKPTQNSIRMLNSYGVQPNFILGRAPYALDDKRKEKIAISCSVPVDHVISAPDIDSVYNVPINFEQEKFSSILLKSLGLKAKSTNDGLADWKRFVSKAKASTQEVSIAVVGKYFDTGDYVLSDAYISVIEAVKFSAYANLRKAKLTWINSKEFENGKKELSMLDEFDGIIVPGGFGTSGIEGVISAIKYARENKIPYFGLCYGMQLMTIEYSRNVLGLKGAHTTEIDPKSPHPVIDIMPEQKKLLAEKQYGASMRLGAYPASVKKGSVAHGAYKSEKIEERHRHRFEVNPAYIEKIEKGGLVFSGKSPDGILMEIAELPSAVHPFFLGTQFHPEFKARPLSPHPLFTAFIKAAVEYQKTKSKKISGAKSTVLVHN
jgi:CTP synthase